MKTSAKVIIGVAAAAAAAALLLPGLLMKRLTLRYLRQTTGFEISYEKLAGSVWKRTIDVDGLVFRNPPDFPEAEAIEVAHLHAKYRWKDLFGDTVKLEELRLDIPRVVMVRKPDGETNLERMQQNSKAGVASPAAPPAPAAVGERESPAVAPVKEAAPEPAAVERPASPAPAAKGHDLEVASLTLKIGRVEMRDYSRLKKGKPRADSYELNVERTFENVTDLDAVGQQLAAQVLVQQGVKALADQLGDPETMQKLNKNLEKVADELSRQLGNFLK